ncbi:hypothetical protein [Micromonospora chokoriensis]|uniref:hypothetical protein n=1 Tax=Micromonospora chokoriensis TaxID=356851 RepID=UPI000689D2D4|nr:hypothetical protein [Micromonospora chokoriensis]
MIIQTGMKLTPQRISIPAGSVSVSFTSQSQVDVVVAYGFTFTNSPRVGVNIASSAGATAGWIAKAHSISTTGFTLRVSGASATWTGVPVQWWAIPS